MIRFDPCVRNPELLASVTRASVVHLGSTVARGVHWRLDLKKRLSDPNVLNMVTRDIAQILQEANIEQIAAYGYGSFLIAGALASIAVAKSAILVRPSPKAYGSKNWLEGTFDQGRPVAIVDDVLVSGNSARFATEVLTYFGLHVAMVIPVISVRTQGAKRTAKSHVPVRPLVLVSSRRL